MEGEKKSKDKIPPATRFFVNARALRKVHKERAKIPFTNEVQSYSWALRMMKKPYFAEWLTFPEREWNIIADDDADSDLDDLNSGLVKYQQKKAIHVHRKQKKESYVTLDNYVKSSYKKDYSSDEKSEGKNNHSKKKRVVEHDDETDDEFEDNLMDEKPDFRSPVKEEDDYLEDDENNERGTRMEKEDSEYGSTLMDDKVIDNTLVDIKPSNEEDENDTIENNNNNSEEESSDAAIHFNTSDNVTKLHKRKISKDDYDDSSSNNDDNDVVDNNNSNNNSYDDDDDDVDVDVDVDESEEAFHINFNQT